MSMPSDPYLKSVVESILFISEKPVTLDNLKEALNSVGLADIRQAILELMKEYEANRRGMIVTEIAGGYQMLSSPEYASYVRNFFKKHVKEKLSRPALETLAIIAYKQPVTRGDIELIRGVNSDGVTELLVNKELIKIVGRKDIPGRPYLYGTTKLFLEYFGLKSLQDLPRLEDFPGLISQSEEDTAALHSHKPLPEESSVRAELAVSGDDNKKENAAIDSRPEGSGPGIGETITDSPEDKRGQIETAENIRLDPQSEAEIAMEDAVELKQAMDEFNRNEKDPSHVAPGTDALSSDDSH